MIFIDEESEVQEGSVTFPKLMKASPKGFNESIPCAVHMEQSPSLPGPWFSGMVKKAGICVGTEEEFKHRSCKAHCSYFAGQS